MPIAPVEVRARPETSTTTGARKSGGQFGAKLGAAIGAVAGGLSTGGAGAVQGGLTGAAAGQALGDWVRPGREGTTAIDRRIQTQSAPQVSGSEKLRESILALHEAPPEIRQQYAEPLVSSYFASLAQERGRGRV